MPTPSLNVVFEQAAKTAIARSGNGRCAVIIWVNGLKIIGNPDYLHYTDVSQINNNVFKNEENQMLEKMFKYGVKEIIAIPYYRSLSDIGVIELPSVTSSDDSVSTASNQESDSVDKNMPDINSLPDFDYIYTTFSIGERLDGPNVIYNDRLDNTETLINIRETINKFMNDSSLIKNARIIHTKEQELEFKNDEYSIVFDAYDMKYNGTHISPFEYLPDLVSIIATTPLDRSATYTELPGITSATYVELENKNNLSIVCKNGVYRLSKAVTAYTGDSKDLKSIKIVNAMKILQNDIISTYEDRYIGKAGNLINKMQFVSAVNTYLTRLVEEGVLYDGFDNTAEIDIDAVKAYLADVAGKDISDMSELDIMNAKTGTNLFLKLNVQFADALEDMTLRVVMN